ncbi:MAG TPA: hypothetical protein VJ741_19045 [Solirubrobacteraceae bacterium]|nr:hypothetical protein [Solirubrobacteraceae bacterium]
MSTWLPVTHRARLWRAMLGVVAITALVALGSPALAHGATVPAVGELDCNGYSPIQHALHSTAACTDVRGFAGVTNANNWNSRFFDNGHYIGHDEPDMSFISNQPGSGNDITWTETLPREPAAAPTDAQPGSDVSHWFELSLAPWFSMQMCNPQSYPLNPCTPESDANAPTPCTISANPCTTQFTGGGSAFMELQFYPPGFAPFIDGVSCDNRHWCSALTIDSLECTYLFATCNGNCEEPVNFAYVQRNGVPTGPPGPEESNLATQTQNGATLLMNPGDHLVIHMGDAPVLGQRGVRAFAVQVFDLTTHQVGFMQASAANGFMSTSITDCTDTPFNFEPEYNTAREENITPWGADRTDVSTQFEIGHFEPCTSVTNPISLPLSATVTDTVWTNCHGPYEDAAPGGDARTQPEATDAPCFPQGDTHDGLNTAPDTITGCVVTFAGGDLDFDGTAYWPEWPVSSQPTRTLPGSFVQDLPTTLGRQYQSFFLQTDLGLSESTCLGNSVAPGGTLPGCAVPPPNAPGKFYPYWSRVRRGARTCQIEFGNVSGRGDVNDFGKDAQYGTNQEATLGYPQFLGPVMPNTCGFSPHKRS